MFHFSNIKRANLRKATTSFFQVFFSNIKLQTFGGNLDYPFEGGILYYITHNPAIYKPFLDSVLLINSSIFSLCTKLD